MSGQWGSFGRRRALIGVGVACAVIGGAAPAVTALASSPPPRVAEVRTYRTASVAIPSRHQPVAIDASARFAATHATEVHVVTSATESSTCDRCNGQALTTQVVYSDRGQVVTVDNAATAWSAQCAHCGGSALSLQIVIARAGVDVSANNRALATNAACLMCRTAAAAVQIVVITRAHSAATLSPEAMVTIRTLRADLMRSLIAGGSTPSGLRPRTSAPAASSQVAGAMQATTRRLQLVLSTDLHAISASHRIVVR
jgi:hypothetical protein